VIDIDVAIIGAGAVGLASAALLAARGDSVLVLEQHGRFGQETSARNSGVIHAGLYYPPGSLKASLCVRGRQLLYARATRQGLAHRRTGKLIIACDETETGALSLLQARAAHNGAGDLRWLDARELRARQPRLRGAAALWSSETGIIDAHALL
jgi:L-2-hydroxyglutarate oxidase LhgO